MENWLSGLGYWQKRENLENRDFHDLGHVEDAFRRKIDVGSVLVCRRGILERMPSLQAGRAETMVDGLPRACRFFGTFWLCALDPTVRSTNPVVR